MRNRKTTTSLAVLCVLGWAVLSHAATVVKPTFSQPHGFYSSSFSVRISSATAGATIRYTTDGSKPTGSYGTALANGGSVSIGRTTPLRAVACKGGMTTSAPFTQTYIFPSQVRSQTRPAGYPVTCYPENGTAYTADYEMDPDIVNHASYSGELVNDLKAIPSISLVLPREKLFGTNGTPDGVWNQGGYHGGQNTLEVETSAEWIYPGRAGFQIDCGLKNHAGPGAKSCCRFLFKSNYGGPQTLDYPVFEDAPLNASSAAATFGKLFLRSGNNDSWFAFWVSDAKQRQRTYLRDEWVRQSMIEMTGFGSHGTFVHVYLNGLYWGVYNVIERPDARHATIYKGGSKSDWYAHNHGGSVSGNASRYNYLHNTLVPSGGFANASTYNTVKQYVDVERFCDYVMTGWYAGTGDWGANNFYAVVRNNPAGGLQYMNWDQDVSWDDAHGVENCGAWVNPTFLGTGGRTSDRNSPMCKLWRALDDNSDFRALFADRVYKHCFNGGALTETRAKARWDAFRNYLDPAMACESARWGDFLKDQGRGATVFTRNDHWRPGCDWVRNQMTGNVGRFVSALRASGYYPSLNPPTFSQHGGTVASGYKLTINRNNGSGTIYYRTDGDDPRVSGGGILAGSSTGAASAVVTLTATTTVKARVKNGATWSALAGATFTVTGSSVPAAPGSLTAAALSATQIRIGWTDNSGNETGFKIDRRQSGASDWVRVATPGANTTTYTDSGLPAATEFYYQVKAYNAAGDSGYSNVAGATTEDTLPAAPSELAAAALSTSQIRVSWSDNSSNETQFKIRWGT
ncbi:MAG: CotH kinase family protein, partial [Kiritimatiellae bacterium]|nr:CotH kinase family protein [Kiritimatiellia bacterium]